MAGQRKETGIFLQSPPVVVSKVRTVVSRDKSHRLCRSVGNMVVMARERLSRMMDVVRQGYALAASWMQAWGDGVRGRQRKSSVEAREGGEQTCRRAGQQQQEGTDERSQLG